MIGQRESLRLFGCEAFDPRGRRIGMVGQLFVAERTEQPEWITVQTGLFGTNESFVPLAGAAFDGDTLTVAVLKNAVRLAPHVWLDQGDLPLEQERELYAHYGVLYGVSPAEVGENCEQDAEYAEAVRLRLSRWATAA